jgi:hypothetical protein
MNFRGNNKSELLFLVLVLLSLSMSCTRKISAIKYDPIPQVNKDVAVTISAEPVKAVPVLIVKDTTDERQVKKDSVIIEGYIPSGKYAKANSLYYEMIDSMAKVILEYPVKDSAGLLRRIGSELPIWDCVALIMLSFIILQQANAVKRFRNLLHPVEERPVPIMLFAKMEQYTIC